MLEKLVKMYEAGAITGYQVIMGCLHRLDPEDPGPILSTLPDEILEEMVAYAQRYDPRGRRSDTFGTF
jgi:hypothetical protein